MTHQAYDAYDEEPQAAVVHWMDRKPVSVGVGGVSAAAAGAFALGAGVTLVALALLHWLGPERDLPDPRGFRWR